MVIDRKAASSLLAIMEANGVRVSARGVQLLVDAPPGTLTPSLKRRIIASRSELRHDVTLHSPCSRCGSPRTVDVAIHEGRSVRRDCAECGLTRGFPRWQRGD